ncbi:unnamed protein product, partial [Mycena citricolor]
VHVSGQFHIKSKDDLHKQALSLLPSMIEQVKSGLRHSKTQLFHRESIYQSIFPRVVQYGTQYCTIQAIEFDPLTLQSLSLFQLPVGFKRGKYIVHPIWLDTLLHAAGFVLNLQCNSENMFICAQAGEIYIDSYKIDLQKSYALYCQLISTDNASVSVNIYVTPSLDPQNVVAHLSNVQFQQVKLLNLQKSFSKVVASQDIQYNGSYTNKYNLLTLKPDCSYEDIDHILFMLLSALCNVPINTLQLDIQLTSLGLDSFLFIELASELSGIFPDLELSTYHLSLCESIRELCNLIQQELAAKKIAYTKKQVSFIEASNVLSRYSSNLVCIQEGVSDEHIPVFLVHDGSGLGDCYKNLFPINRAVWAFYNPKLTQ